MRQQDTRITRHTLVCTHTQTCPYPYLPHTRTSTHTQMAHTTHVNEHKLHSLLATGPVETSPILLMAGFTFSSFRISSDPINPPSFLLLLPAVCTHNIHITQRICRGLQKTNLLRAIHTYASRQSFNAPSCHVALKTNFKLCENYFKRNVKKDLPVQTQKDSENDCIPKIIVKSTANTM